MASQALYRRYRSQTFDELIGQEHIVQTLRNALAEGRIAHAYLFTGPRGVGKTTVARLLAKAVNCTAPLEQRPCGECESCRAIAEGRAVDVIEMDAASHTSVEDAREIIERVNFRPTSATYKVYVIDECHMLSTAAFNALLKTLEEPPGHALFILATTEVHKVPATILSRCQRFTFNRHSVSATAAHLREIASQEGFALEAGVPEIIARAATGSMRDALSVLDQLMAYGGETIALVQVRELLGATESQEVAALVAALLAADLSGALRVVSDVAARGADLRQFTRDLVERLRALMLLKAGADPSLLDMTDDDLAVLEEQASESDLHAILGWTRLFGELDHQLRTSPYGQLPLELAVVEAIAVPQAELRQPAASERRPAAAPAVGASQVRSAATRPAPQPVQSAPPAPRNVPAAPQAPPPVARQSAPVAEPEPQVDPFIEHQARERQPETTNAPVADAQQPAPVESQQPAPPQPVHKSSAESEEFEAANADVVRLEYVEGIWPGVIRDVRVYDKTLQALLNSGVRPVDVKENTVILEVANDWLLSRLEKPNLRQIVERVISKHMNAEYMIRCVVEAQRRENPNALREQIRSSRKDPLVKAAINIFDADIIRVESDEE